MALGKRMPSRRPGRVGRCRCGRDVQKTPWGRSESDHETLHGVLKGGERDGVGEGGVEVGEDLGHGRVPGRRGRLRWRVPAQEERADVALAENESSPESLPGSGTEPAADVACGVGDAVGNRALEEAPQPSGGDARASNFVGEPNADGPSATGARAAVRAKDSPGSDGFFAGRSRRHNRKDSHGERACRPRGSADTPST